MKGFRQLATSLTATAPFTRYRRLRGASGLTFIICGFLFVVPLADGDISTELLRNPPIGEPPILKHTHENDLTSASKLYREAVRYDSGKGTLQDLRRARQLYLQAADLGHVNAMLSVGLMLSQGQGGSLEEKEGAHWLLKAGERGLSDGQYSVGVMYMGGKGVEQSYLEAHRWFLRAAGSGHAQAMNNLGVLYAKGLGVKQEPMRAYAWFKLAMEAGSTDGEENLDATAEVISVQERTRGDGLAKELLALPRR